LSTVGPDLPPGIPSWDSRALQYGRRGSAMIVGPITVITVPVFFCSDDVAIKNIYTNIIV